MARTSVRSVQIKDQNVWRDDVNTTTSGKAVITKLLPNDNPLSIVSTGVDPGTGDVTITLNYNTDDFEIIGGDLQLKGGGGIDLIDGGEII